MTALGTFEAAVDLLLIDANERYAASVGGVCTFENALQHVCDNLPLLLRVKEPLLKTLRQLWVRKRGERTFEAAVARMYVSKLNRERCHDDARMHLDWTRAQDGRENCRLVSVAETVRPCAVGFLPARRPRGGGGGGSSGGQGWTTEGMSAEDLGRFLSGHDFSVPRAVPTARRQQRMAVPIAIPVRRRR